MDISRSARHYKPAMRLALFEPDIPPNTGAMLRLAACLGVPVDIIEPCGFPFSERGFRRAGMDYLELATLVRHGSFDAFEAARRETGGRLVLLTTKARTPYTDFAFVDGDVILVGRESAGVPEHVHDIADARLLIPIIPAARSLNVAMAAAMALGEALRQTQKFPQKDSL